MIILLPDVQIKSKASYSDLAQDSADDDLSLIYIASVVILRDENRNVLTRCCLDRWPDRSSSSSRPSQSAATSSSAAAGDIIIVIIMWLMQKVRILLDTVPG